ncbi:MAG: hypothetical protein HYV27_02060 [Candidatus Hydrogenedentes bacterium]|nr:hypothetical protein [Candidatus Hydrogenedentota bacterium]
MKYAIPILCVILLLCAGCKKEEPPPPPPEKPPPPTADELYKEIRDGLAAVYAAEPRDAVIELAAVAQVLQAFPGLVQKCGLPDNKANGDQALEKVRADFDRMLKDTPDLGKWRFVRCVLDLYKLLPGGQEKFKKYATLDHRTDLMLARPQVRSTGFVEVDGELYAFLRVIERDSGETDAIRVREGEEFYQDINGNNVLKLIRIIGNKEKLEIEYLPLADTWEIIGAGKSK